MQNRFAMLTLALAILVAPATGRAQSYGDIAAWAALSTTPAGGLPALPFLTAALRPAQSVHLRIGHLNGDGGESGLNIAGLTFTGGIGRNAQLAVTGGSAFCDGCDGSIMLGTDVDVPLRTTGQVLVALRPAAGFVKYLGEGGGSGLSAALSLPISLVLGQSGRSRVVPFVDPGFGYGRISADGDTESGTRPILGGGVAITGSRVGFIASAKRVMLEGAKTQFGAGFSIAINEK